VPLTAADLERLTRFTNEAPEALVEWLAPLEVDMTGEPESFVELAGGKRLAVLAHREGACRFLDASNGCTVYEARPACCGTFPLELARPEPHGVRRLTLLEHAQCRGAFDAPPDAAEHLANLARREHELAEYLTIVLGWNRRQRRRRLAGRRIEGARQFLAHVLNPTRTRNA
jgi:Fe-S-cluster containining protein